MAISIKTTPVLIGETAENFIIETYTNSANSTPVLSETMETNKFPPLPQLPPFPQGMVEVVETKEC